MDTLVFDIETQNFFTDPAVGRDNFEALRISVVGVYSYIEEKYLIFEEGEMEALAELFDNAKRLVGFSMNRYDVPVLNTYFRRLGPHAPNLWEKERVDLLESIELLTGQRISLSRLAEANLHVKKDRRGSEAITLYQEGRMEELKEYCLKDVELTKALYELYERDHALLVPNKITGKTVRLEFGRGLK